jgi:Mrp family chromosome partitioning ATPase
MENIEQALERLRAQQGADPQKVKANTRGRAEPAAARSRALNSALLQSNRIISHVIADPRSRSFDMLRTQILQSMDTKDWRVLAVTSPTPNCGKTVVALNLAISVARQPERSALVVDLDFQRPKVATALGLGSANDGVLSVLNGEATLQSAVLRARIGE